MKVVVAALLLVAACDTSPHSRSQRIGSLEETIGGPHAIGTIGDFLLENDQIRLIISDTGVNADPTKLSTYGRVNTTYGGSLVDADLVRVGGGNAKGNDQLAELLPGLLFTVINPTEVCVPVRATGRCPTMQEKASGAALADGADGLDAEVVVVGTGGDLLQMVSLLNTGLVMPSGLELKNTYKLFPGKKYVEIETTVTNKSSGAHPFPYLNPTDLSDLLGGYVPDIPIQISVPAGQLPLFGGEQDLFAPGVAGFNVKYAIEDSYPFAGGFPAFPGLAVDFLATKGNGVSYGISIPDSPSNFVSTYATGYPGQDVTPYSMVVPFTYAGVAAAYTTNPPAQLMAGQSFSYTTYFTVGRGDVASVAETIYGIRGVPMGSFGGSVVDGQTHAPVPHANVLVLDGQGRVVNQLEADGDGAFVAKMPVGHYEYQTLTDDRMDPTPTAFEVKADEKTGVLIQLTPPATLAVSVVDEKGRQAPVKIQLIGTYDPSNVGKDPRDFLYSLQKGQKRRVTAFDGGNRYIENAWWTKDGLLQAHVRPGTYQLAVSRGPEYEVTTVNVKIAAGAFVEQTLTLTPAYTSPGWVAGDFHIHANPSTDSGVPIADRVISCAAEGLEVAVATDHNFITDYAATIGSSGLDPWLLGMPGMELTTFEMGHFNGYPLKIDSGSTRGGEFRWAMEPPGTLFKQLRELGVDPANTIVQVNHPRQTLLGYFQQFFVDPATAQPYTPTGILGVFAPYGDEFAADQFSYDFDAVELLTGRKTENIHNFVAPNPLPPGTFPNPQPVPGTVVVDPDGRPKFPGVVETWFTLLDRGKEATGMGTSDAHDMLGDEPGYARTLVFVGTGKDIPGGFSRSDVVNAIKAHRAIVTTAPFVEIHVGSAMIGDTVKATGGGVDVVVHISSPSWAKVNKLIIYSSGGGKIEQAIPADSATEYTTTVHVATAKDSWVTAEVTGDANMFPVSTPVEFPPLDATVIISALSAGLDLSSLPIASNLKPNTQHASTPYAMTNPIWVDANGDGTWTPPGQPLPKAASPLMPAPDVRDQFAHLPEITP
ncbi:MAG TPA: CehA/McbA family metallohydrolase [Kofleriaceae bacterium]